MKLVILDGFLVNAGDLDWAPLKALGELTVYDETAPEDIIARTGDADAIFINRTQIKAEVFDACPKLKYVGMLATGYNGVDCKAARAHGVSVVNVPGYSKNAVAQMAFALLLNIKSRISDYDRYTKSGAWISNSDHNMTDIHVHELFGQTLGILGMGDIGMAVAKIANAFGMRVIAYKRNPSDEMAKEGNFTFVDLNTLYAQSDVISIHCPLTDETRGMINRDSVAKMKDQVVIINTARGAVLDEQAVSDALDSGKIAAVGADVLSVEPPKQGNVLLENARSTITPHMAWGSFEARKRLIDLVAKNYQAYLNGSPINVVN